MPDLVVLERLASVLPWVALVGFVFGFCVKSSADYNRKMYEKREAHLNWYRGCAEVFGNALDAPDKQTANAILVAHMEQHPGVVAARAKEINVLTNVEAGHGD